MSHPEARREPIDVVWCIPHPNHYNTCMFERVSRLDGVRLSLLYFDRQLAIYPWKSSFPATFPVSYLHRRLGIDWGFVLARLRASREVMIASGWYEPTILLLLLCFSAIGRPFLIWSDTPNPRRRTGLKQWLRGLALSVVLRNVFRYMVTGTPGVEAVRRLGVPAGRIVNLPYATDTDVFTPADPPRPATGPVVCLSSGRLDIAHKGYDTAIAAFALVRQRHPEAAFRWVIAGEGPDRDAIRRLLHDAGLSAHVELRGWLEPGDLPAFYRGGDVLVHPANFDAYGVAVLEAMASGLPVVGSLGANAVKDRVVDGENGFTHEAGDVETLARKLAAFLTMPPEARRDMGRLARGTAVRWHVDRHAAIVQGVLDDLRAERAGAESHGGEITPR